MTKKPKLEPGLYRNLDGKVFVLVMKSTYVKRNEEIVSLILDPGQRSQRAESIEYKEFLAIFERGKFRFAGVKEQKQLLLPQTLLSGGRLTVGGTVDKQA